MKYLRKTQYLVNTLYIYVSYLAAVGNEAGRLVECLVQVELEPVLLILPVNDLTVITDKRTDIM